MRHRQAAKTTLDLRREDGTPVCACEVADTAPSRMKGLLGRDGLGEGEGLLIRPAPSIMTFFMRFPIDAVFLDRDWRIVKIVRELGPWRTAACRRAHATLELAAGEAARRGLEVGQRLEVA